MIVLDKEEIDILLQAITIEIHKIERQVSSAKCTQRSERKLFLSKCKGIAQKLRKARRVTVGLILD